VTSPISRPLSGTFPSLATGNSVCGGFLPEAEITHQ
jgi:hypothetical protein